MARKMVVTATGKSYTATTTPATVQIPFNSADMWPSLLTISATAPVHIRLGDPSVTAATTDLMVQPADHVTIRTNGAGYISYRSASGTCNVQISPTEDGPMNYRGQIPDYIQGILAPYGSNAHVYLPGASGATVAGFQTGNYTANDGSTGYSAVDGTAGLVLDAAGAVGADLAGTLDGTWTRDATVSNVGSTMVASGLASSTNGFYKSIGASGAGNTYLVTVVVSAYTSGQITAWLGGQQTAASNAFLSAAGTLQFVVTATGAANGAVVVGSNVASNTWTVSSISVKQVTGIHASQATAGNRPAERRGLYNLLTYSNDLTQATAWGLNAVTGAGGLLKPDTSSAIHRASRTATTVVSGSPYTMACRVSASGYRYLYLNGAASPNQGQACFDLKTGVVAATTTGVATISAVGDGTFICCVSGVAAAVSNQAFLQVNNAGVASDTTFAGDGVSGINFYSAILTPGTLTASQILAEGGIPLTTSAAASNSAAGKYWFDCLASSSMYMALGSVPFQLADDYVIVAAGMSTDFGASGKVLAGLGGAGAGFTELSFSPTTNYPRAVFKDDAGTTVTLADTKAYTSNIVMAMRKVGNNKTFWVNGAQVGATDTTVMAATTFTNANLFARYAAGATNSYHNGPAIEPILIKGIVSDADLLTLMRQVALNTPAGPVF